MANAMQSTIVPVLDDDTIKNELEQMRRSHPDFQFDTSFTLNGSLRDTKSEYVINFEPDESSVPTCNILPEVEAMQRACASGDLMSVQSVFKTYWLNQPVDERLDKNIFGASSLCEAIKHDDSIIGSYLLSHVVSMHEGHFALATEERSYSFLQLCVDQGWDINMCLGQQKPPALS